jgi:hypothetical protein
MALLVAAQPIHHQPIQPIQPIHRIANDVWLNESLIVAEHRDKTWVLSFYFQMC